MSQGRFSQFDEDEYRLPEGMRRIAYDADTQQYTFRDRSGQLYESAPGCKYGVLTPAGSATSIPHRRNATITEIPDAALRQWSEKPAKTFDDILPSGYITAAQSGVQESPTRILAPGERWVQGVQSVVEAVRRHTSLRGRSATGPSREKGAASEPGARGWGRARSKTWGSARDTEKRMELLEEEKSRLLEDEAAGGRLAHSKSEIRSSRRTWSGRK